MKKVQISLAVFASFLSAGALFADGAKTFKRKCASCHTLVSGGKKLSSGKVGPDLSGLAGKRPEEYLKLYMSNPADARKKFADIYNKEISGKFTMKMPSVSISEEEAKEIIELLK